MATLQELLSQTFENNASTKTASARAQESDDTLTKLAKELDLDGFFGKQAEEEDKEEKDEDKGEEKDEEKEEEKAAGVNLDGLYSMMFPEDRDIAVKTAEEEKNAAEEALGARAFDHYSSQWDRRIEKLAADTLSGAATISASTAANPTGAVQRDVTPPQAQANNKPSDSSSAVNTKSTSIQDEVKAKNDASTVGHFEQKHAGLALQKHLLLLQLGK